MLSGGIGSWMAARRVRDEFGTNRMGSSNELVLLFADTMMEDGDTYRFLDAAVEDLEGRFVRLCDGRDIWQVFRDVKFLGNSRIDPCSRVLKRELMRKWVDENCAPDTTIVYVGIDWTESHRAERYGRYWHPYAVRCPLTEPPYILKAHMLAEAESAGLPSQRLYEMGFHHANCGGGCVKAGQAQFELLLRKMPERYAWWEENEESIRVELGKDIAILRDRTGGKSRPISLREFRERLEQQPGLFDEDEWGGCACTVPMDDELRIGVR